MIAHGPPERIRKSALRIPIILVIWGLMTFLARQTASIRDGLKLIATDRTKLQRQRFKLVFADFDRAGEFPQQFVVQIPFGRFGERGTFPRILRPSGRGDEDQSGDCRAQHSVLKSESRSGLGGESIVRHRWF